VPISGAALKVAPSLELDADSAGAMLRMVQGIVCELYCLGVVGYLSPPLRPVYFMI